MPEIADKISEILDKFPNLTRDVLIPILQEVQDSYGYITHEAVLVLSAKFSLPASKIYGLATFYNQFRFQPRGKYHIQVCNGASCHLSHSAKMISELEKDLNIGEGGVTRDQKFSFEAVPCIGACAQSPVISVNQQYHTKLTTQRLREIINSYREEDKDS